MDHLEMVALISAGGAQPGETWADLGAGTGNFTRALAELVGPSGMVYAVDRDARALETQRAYSATARGATIVLRQADLTRRLDLPPLDGLLLANVLHFIRDQAALLVRLCYHLKPGGRLLVVEYEQARPITWVPFPLPQARFVALATATGLEDARQIGFRRSPSSGQAMYAAAAVWPGDHSAE